MAQPLSLWKDSQLIPMRQRDNEEYQPSQQEIFDYAQHIGLERQDILNEQLLMLAYEGIRAQLPPGWEACSTPDQDIVYRNILTREVFEEHPLDSIYRQRAIQLKKAFSQATQSEGSIIQEESVIQEELSQIEEDENQLRNQSDVYERGRYNFVPPSRDLLRKSINQKGFKEIIGAENTWSQNSALNRNISSRDIGNGQHEINQNKLLPSSLLEIQTLPLQEGLEYYNTVITQVEGANNRKGSKMSSVNESVKLQEKKLQLQELQKQYQLKSALLQQIRQSNAQKTAKLKKLLHLKKK